VESSLLAILALGFVLGLKHATDPDHVVAVTTFVSEQKSLVRSCWIGAFWGAGHTISLTVAGLAVILFKINIPQWMETRLEFAVAVMLVVLGARVLYKTWNQKLELHRHPHSHAPGMSPHVHWHVHARGPQHEHSGWLHVGLRPLLVGMVHGAAGSGALMLLVLSTIHSGLQALLYIAVFGLGSIAGMLVISALLALPMQWLGKRVATSYRPVQIFAGLFSCVFGIWLGAEIWKSF
jgi:ABC-type nickel/cobalt efflux system permease component RcnA